MTVTGKFERKYKEVEVTYIKLLWTFRGKSEEDHDKSQHRLEDKGREQVAPWIRIRTANKWVATVGPYAGQWQSRFGHVTLLVRQPTYIS
jgi:hypothetical protein